MYHVMNNDHKNNKNNKNSKNNSNNNNEKNDNKILIDYFNSMYLDCVKNVNINNQCDFIKEKIYSLNQKQTQNPKTPDDINNILYAIAK